MGESGSQLLEVAESLNGKFITSLCQVVAENHIWLSVGGFPEIVENDNDNDIDRIGGTNRRRVYNTHIIINPSGTISYPVYRKMHLFDCPLVNLQESLITSITLFIHSLKPNS
jgi:predicted amidohydrolase